MNDEQERDLAFEMQCAWEGLFRYGNCPASEYIVDIISLIDDMNDDIAHGRHLEEKVSEIKDILDKIVKEYPAI